ncbi:serine/threonine dehydratase [Rhizocola hellebori]|uniref:Serine/threonine dehydratase n=1 Tax=Rhizocola hellebori TaxID=1392758 RepID=A0A8J3QEK7_9ACTN|nr:threonine/serine dehydratase [Rhizocola hellebori]GIH08269.1 serine/threonine dehydratase [Rhizocola hellebori]
MQELISVDDVRAAAARIGPHVLRTPAVDSPGLTAVLGVPVSLKLENLQRSGCFKPRGITNKVLSLTPAELGAGVVTVSGGNHGRALAQIAQQLGFAATIVMPQSAPAHSIAAVRASGATLLLAHNSAAAFEQAEQISAQGHTYIHAYDDPLIIAGHGTAGLEFAEDKPGLTDVIVSIGGGALISGTATAIKSLLPHVRVWGVETVGAEAMSQAMTNGKPVPVTISSICSTLAAPYATDRTLAHVQALVQEVLVVPDAEAVKGVLTLAEHAKLWAEPASGCLIAAASRVIEQVGPDITLGLLICGGNVSYSDLAGWVSTVGQGAA